MNLFPSVEQLTHRPAGAGKVFFADTRSWGAGSDSNEGTDPNYPLATVTAALAKATAGRHDYIFLLDGYDNDEVSIVVNKSATHIIGLGTDSHRSPFVWLLVNAGALPVFTLQGNNSANCEIAGFTLGADATHPCITTKVGASTELVFAHLHHLSFAAALDPAFVAQDGIVQLDGTGLDGILIEDCTFGQQLVRDGIRFKTFYQGMIRRCLFRGVPGIGIDQIATGAATGVPDILDNSFWQKTAQDKGSSITITDGGGGAIHGNHTVSNGGHAGNNPYLDTSTGTDTTTLNGWGENFLGDTVKYPAFA